MIEAVHSRFDAAARLDQTIDGRFTHANANSLTEISVLIGNEVIDLIRTTTQDIASFTRAHPVHYIPPEDTVQVNVNVYHTPF